MLFLLHPLLQGTFRSARLPGISFCTNVTPVGRGSCHLPQAAFDRAQTVPSFGKLPLPLVSPVPVSGFYIKEFSSFHFKVSVYLYLFNIEPWIVLSTDTTQIVLLGICQMCCTKKRTVYICLTPSVLRASILHLEWQKVGNSKPAAKQYVKNK